MVEPGVHDEMLRTAAHLRASLALAVGPWARAQSSDEQAAEILATETARSIAALAQGYIANSAVFGPRPVEDYLESAAAVLAS
jgi:hypothetical protein